MANWEQGWVGEMSYKSALAKIGESSYHWKIQVFKASISLVHMGINIGNCLVAIYWCLLHVALIMSSWKN